MIHALLASWLATQTWAWSPVVGATSYRVYWGASMVAWCATHRVEYPASVCSSTECQGDIPMPDFTPAYIIVTAVNAAGEGVTGHGSVVVCP
jgi:hypothetical protein